jgi:hypothetical protein
MKLFSKVSALAAVLVLSTAFTAAESISVGSYGASNGNGGSAPAGPFDNTAVMFGAQQTYNISPGGAWSGPAGNSSWVSYDPNSGPTGGNVDPNATYTYTTSFDAEGGVYSGSMIIMADDTANVLLNGVEIISFGALGTNSHCADVAPNCTSMSSFDLTSITLLAGTNTLTFNVQQTALVYQGLDFSGSLTNGSPVPEPGSLLLFGTGLIGSAGALLRRMKASALK